MCGDDALREQVVGDGRDLSVGVGAQSVLGKVNRANACSRSDLVIRFVKKKKKKNTYPRIPSTPSKPSDVDATPMDCALIVRPLPSETVSVNSVPLNEPDPY